MSYLCWILADDKKIGSQNQAVGLAERMGWPFRLHRIDLPCVALKTQQKEWVKELERQHPYPSIVISAGRRSHPVAILFKEKHPEVFSIALLNPYGLLPYFDLVIAPEHENLRGPNVLSTRGVLHRITEERLKKGSQQESFVVLRRPLLGVLIGGASKHYSWTHSAAESLMAHHPPFLPPAPPRFRFLLQSLRDLHAAGWGIFVLPSRRTPVWLVKELEKCAAPHSSFVVEQGNTACNPYISVLAASDVLLVTADSISMISEACATQKPVYIFPLAGFSRKLSVLHEAFYDTDSARPFLRTIDRWSSPIKDRALETVIVTVAAKVQDFFSAQKFGTRKSSV